MVSVDRTFQFWSLTVCVILLNSSVLQDFPYFGFWCILIGQHQGRAHRLYRTVLTGDARTQGSHQLLASDAQSDPNRELQEVKAH